jgi:hypothetical protein
MTYLVIPDFSTSASVQARISGSTAIASACRVRPTHRGPIAFEAVEVAGWNRRTAIPNQAFRTNEVATVKLCLEWPWHRSDRAALSNPQPQPWCVGSLAHTGHRQTRKGGISEARISYTVRPADPARMPQSCVLARGMAPYEKGQTGAFERRFPNSFSTRVRPV